MTATNHGLFGAVIAISLQKYPAVALAIAPFSHFLLDAIPHFGDLKMSPHGKQFFKILITDCTLAVITTLLVAWVWKDIALLVVVCSFLAASPDLMWLYFEYLKPTKKNKLPWFAKFHSWIQWSQTPRGVVVELAWFAIFISGLVLAGLG